MHIALIPTMCTLVEPPGLVPQHLSLRELAHHEYHGPHAKGTQNYRSNSGLAMLSLL